MVHEEFLKTQHSTTTEAAGSSVEKVMKNIPRAYFGISMTVGKMITACIPMRKGDSTLQ